MEWLSIETAPKDGTSILAYDYECQVVHWVGGDEGYDGWYDNEGEYSHSPTHWMPLPAPPAESEIIAEQNRRDIEG